MAARQEVLREAWRIVEELGGRALREAWRIAEEWEIAAPSVRKALDKLRAGWRDLARPAIVALSCRAVGGDVEKALRAAAPLILLSGGFDLHDDIIDRSITRGPRRRKTILGLFGPEVTMLLGDALLVGGAWRLASTLSEMGLGGGEAERIMRLIFELGEAEAMELGFVRRLDVAVPQYLKLVEKKAADVEAYARLGAAIGEGGEQQREALGRFGRRLGMMAIVRDDLEDLLEYRVELKNRVLYESLPLPVLRALRSRRSSGRLRELLSKTELSVEELREVVRLTERGGGVRYTLEVLRQLSAEAEKALDEVRGDVEGLRILLKATVPPLIEGA
ncbi:MAG: polyprenyl synthetase family protein [Candidatus Nezhaarchaeota archaeon]|nr:polyprenyl synthetase family protein [Candidatus Nezhaarchaeota archaeon]